MPYLPFAVLSSPFQLDVPILHVHLGTVSDAHGHRAEEVQTRGAVSHLWTQQNVTFVQFLDTKTQQKMFLIIGDIDLTAQVSSHEGGAEITSAGWWWRCCPVITAAPPLTVTSK